MYGYVVLKTDTQTINYNFYAGEICKILDVWKDSYGAEFANIENDKGIQIIVNTKFLENVSNHNTK